MGTFATRKVYENAIRLTASAGGTALFDTKAVSTLGVSGSPQTFNFSGSGAAALALDIGSGSNGTTNRALLAFVMFPGNAAGTASAVSCTWNGVSLTPIGGPYSNGTRGDIYIFGLCAPDTGQHDFIVTYSGGTLQVAVIALSVVAANQTGGTTTFRNATSNGGSGTTSSVTVTSATGEMVAAAHMAGADYTAAGNSGTDIGIQNGGNVSAMAANRDAGGASVALTYTNGNSDFISAGVSIKAA